MALVGSSVAISFTGLVATMGTFTSSLKASSLETISVAGLFSKFLGAV
jgi:hypothetical protein